MPETRNIIDKLRLTYEGLFSVPELYRLIDNWFHEKGYDKRETKNMEKVTSEGRHIELVLQPWKKTTDYAKLVITLRIIMTDIKEVVVERGGTKVKLNQGKVQMVFDGQLCTDYENRWESSPTYYFLRGVYEKFINRPIFLSWEEQCAKDTRDLHAEIKAFLNLYRYQK